MSKRTRAELEAPSDEPACRICWGDTDDGPLVQPCACRGSVTWVHANCLEAWRRTSAKDDAIYRCGQCKDNYRDELSLTLLNARLQAQQNAGNAQAALGTKRLLASEMFNQGKHAEAEPLYREALEASRATLGDRHPHTLTSINGMANLLHAQGKHAEAEPLCREALEVRRATLGDRHPDTLTSINNMALLLKAQGKHYDD